MTDKPDTAVGGNSVDAALLADYVKKVEAKLEQQLSLQGSYMKDCAEIQATIKAIKKDAKANGVSLKEFNTLLKDRELDRKKERLRADLEPDQLMLYDKMKDALRGGHKDGGLATLPLGAAALAAAAPSAEAKADPIDQIGRGPVTTH